jgi:hypothetical protein
MAASPPSKVCNSGNYTRMPSALTTAERGLKSSESLEFDYRNRLTKADRFLFNSFSEKWRQSLRASWSVVEKLRTAGACSNDLVINKYGILN